MTANDQYGDEDQPLILNKLLHDSGIWSLAGALLGVVGTLVTTSVSANMAAGQSRQEFFLTERVSVYASLLADAQAFQLSAAQYNGLLQAEADQSEVDAVRAIATEDYERVVASSWKVEVIAVEKIRSAKDEIARNMDRAWNLMDQRTVEAAEFFEGLDENTRVLSAEFSKETLTELGVNE